MDRHSSKIADLKQVPETSSSLNGPKNPFEKPFNLKLSQLDGEGPYAKTLRSIFVTFDTLQEISQKERVLVWSIPLVALQRKM